MSSWTHGLAGTRRVMTGATGFVGSHFALRCSDAGNPPITLTRASSDGGARGRVAEGVQAAAWSLGRAGAPEAEQALALSADLSRPDCGIGGDALARLRRAEPEQFWHFAASLRYEDKHRDEIFSSNLTGTEHALQLAKKSGCDTFVYVSTAYTAGRQSGAIEERLHDGASGFNNAYEESKAQAERLVAEFCTRERLRFAILRPSIVIGPFSSKSTGGSNTGLYGFMREIRRVAAPLRVLGRPIELRGDARTACNLIPVDWFIDDIQALVERGLANESVHHNTCSHPLTIEQVARVVAQRLEVPGFVFESRSAPLSPLELRLSRRTSFYGSYWCNSKSFLRARPARQELNLTDIDDYVKGFLQELAPAARVA